MKVLLTDGTVGNVSQANVGDTVTVNLQDENGMPIEVSGVVDEILED